MTQNDRVCSRIHEVFVNYMMTTLKEGNVKDKTIMKIVKRLCFGGGGDVMFDRVTGKYLIFTDTIHF